MRPTDTDLASLVSSERVVVFQSGLTDISRVRSALERAGLAHRFESMPMGDHLMRDRFHRLKRDTGWPTLPMIFVDGEFIGGENELLDHPLLSAGTQPAPTAQARWLGLSGLAPFFLPVAGILAGENDAWFLGWLLAYGAVILSFVGALQWGIALEAKSGRRAERFVVSVLPALAGWLALMLPSDRGILLVIAGFLGIYAYERATLWRAGYPAWFRRLRTELTAGACLALVAGLLASST